MPRVAFRDFSLGLWVNSPKDAIPEGGWPRFRAIHPIASNSIRSRDGSTLIQATQTARSLFRFNFVRFQKEINAPANPVDHRLLRAGVIIVDTLQTVSFVLDRLSFSVAQPPFGNDDYLFVAGGGRDARRQVPLETLLQLFKVSRTGAVSRWGIRMVPGTGVGPAVAAGAGPLVGAYTWRVTFLNGTTGTRSNPTNASAVYNAVTEQVTLTNIPVSADNQTTAREIWRTVGNGTIHFKVGELAGNVATTFLDNIADTSLLSEELPFDNAPPDPHFMDAVGPYQGRMWYGRIDTTAPAITGLVQGGRGRVLFSPIARVESAQGGFLQLTSDDDTIQKLVIWNGALWCVTSNTLFQIVGVDEPFTFRQMEGVPGTVAPYTVVPTMAGIIYQAHDGIRLFDGANSTLIGFDAVGRLFRGESAEGIAAFEGVVAEFARDEYIISNETTTLAIDIHSGKWRNLGLGLSTIYYEPDTQELTAGIAPAGQTFIIEDEGTFTDGGTPIAFEVETLAVRSDVAQKGLVQRFYVECNTGGQILTANAIIDGVVIALPNVNTAARATVELPTLLTGRTLGLRLTGSLTARVEIFGIEADIHPAIVAIPQR